MLVVKLCPTKTQRKHISYTQSLKMESFSVPTVRFVKKFVKKLVQGGSHNKHKSEGKTHTDENEQWERKQRGQETLDPLQFNSC